MSENEKIIKGLIKDKNFKQVEGQSDKNYDGVMGAYAKKILDRLQKLDRENVGKLLYKNAEYDNMHSSQFFRTACEICNLIPEQPKFATEQEIRGILKKFIGRHTTMYSGTAFEDAVSQLSKLSIPDRDRVRNAILDNVYQYYGQQNQILGFTSKEIHKIINAICKTGGEDDN